MLTNKHNALHKYLSGTTTHILNIIRIHIEIPDLLGIICDFLESKFDPERIYFRPIICA